MCIREVEYVLNIPKPFATSIREVEGVGFLSVDVFYDSVEGVYRYDPLLFLKEAVAKTTALVYFGREWVRDKSTKGACVLESPLKFSEKEAVLSVLKNDGFSEYSDVYMGVLQYVPSKGEVECVTVTRKCI